MNSTLHTTTLRRALIRLSSTLLGLIAVVGIMSLFAIWSMNRAYIATDSETDLLGDLAEESLRAGLEFKVQVQEWKNILLRGEDPALKTEYLAAFSNREAAVNEHLSRLAEMAAKVDRSDIRERANGLLNEHQLLAGKYREALGDTPDLSPDGARRIDRSVRGIDRKLENELNHLSRDIYDFSRTRRVELIESLGSRYITLQRALLIVIVFFILVTALSLYSALRVIRN